ncbi:MAG: fumarylacetoacetate hydrolase family protein [Peptococcaceae bacterium]
MKLATFDVVTPAGDIRRIGAVSGKYLVDLNYAYAAFLKSKEKIRCRQLANAVVPPDMIEFLEGGEESLEAARQAVNFVQEKLAAPTDITGPQGEKVAYLHEEIKLRAPIPRPRKVIETGSNFNEHVTELNEVKVAGWDQFKDFLKTSDIPSGFLKASNCVIGHEEDIIHPRTTEKLDYEVELGIVIGKRGRYIKQDDAYDYIVGYTCHCDVSARDIQVNEQANRLVLIGKSMDTFCPLGPYIVTKDEVPDPTNIRVQTFVDGESRQDSYTSNMIHSVPKLVSWWSQLTLEPGDIITSGTPGGVAGFRAPDPTPYFLRPGQTLEVKIEGVGTLRNRIVADQDQ